MGPFQCIFMNDIEEKLMNRVNEMLDDNIEVNVKYLVHATKNLFKL